ncbi:DnaD domain protein [Streptococcus didelphis]|uniref:DnaD domain protein n=1 Tax=Streptococcus didelphis TaxID=102886 RepID=A0ABY9LI57_9STRE|nr:DnaD domain protein [Streptococcus didelphis]WMB28576.1 DnaD domain protein [Streptococcus didelphis]
MIKPIDDFYYLKHNKVLCNSNSLIQLYFPIIGNDAVAVYQYLINFCDEGKRSHKFTELLNHLQFGMTRLEDALVMLTAVDLLVLYQLPDHYLFKIQPSMDNEEFLANPIYRRLLEQKIGQLAVSDLEIKIPQAARNISKRFSDVFGKSSDSSREEIKKVKKTVTFDLVSFQQLMGRDGLQFVNENEDVITLYSLSEKYGMTWFDTYNLAKETAINGKIAPSRMLAKKAQKANASEKIKQGDFTSAEQIIIREAKADTAQLFLEKIKKARRARVTKDEKELLISLAKMDFLDEVINVMVLYTFNKTKSANLQKNYILKIANDFSYQKIVSAEDAVLKMRSFGDKRQETKAKSSKSNVPTWSNPDYQEKTTQEEQLQLDKFKKEALQRLNKLKKGGD